MRELVAACLLVAGFICFMYAVIALAALALAKAERWAMDKDEQEEIANAILWSRERERSGDPMRWWDRER